jgi:lysophospholipase L1-like esterase
MKPYQVLIFLVAVMAITGGLYWAFPEKGVEPELVELDSLGSLDTMPKPQPIVAPKVVVDSTTDSRVFLKTFYAALASTDTQVVRVVHYGDSQIEEDRMSQQIREVLQARFGGRGVGLMPLAQTITSRTVKQQLHMNGRMVQPQAIRRYMVYAPKRDQRADGLYGVMGQVAIMNDSIVKGSEELMAVCTPQDERNRYTKWQILADSTISDSIVGDTVWLRGKGKVYGLSQESETGVIVDNIPMRGCLGLVFTKIDSAQLATFYREANVRLIILQFGGNAIPSNRNPGTISGIVKGLRQQVQYLRTLAPEASILFIGPSDMLTQEDGEWITYPMVPYMDKLLRKMALEENIAYFSLYRWMGGAGSMKHWQEIGLAGSDGVHFMRSGARKAGNAVANWIVDGMD